MPSSAHSLAPFFQIHQLFGGAAVDGFDHAAWTEAPRPGCTHPTWILAHVVGVRRDIARNLGAVIEREPWEDQVAFGNECLPAGEYPEGSELLAEYARLGEQLAADLAEADESVLARAFEPTFPDGVERTVGEALPFLISHEALHLGQLSYVRRLKDLPGIASVVLDQMQAGAQ